jgi:hypothetical protein
MEQRFKGGMDKQSKTFKGMLSNVTDFIGKAGRTLGMPIFTRLETSAANLLKWFDKIQQNKTLEDMAAKFDKYLTNKFEYFNRVIAPKLSSIYDVIRDIAKKAFPDMEASFESMRPKLEYLVVNGLDLVYKALKWINDNYDAVKFGIETIGAAWLAYNGIISTVRTAQLLLNTAMSLNPVIAILAALYLVIFHFDKVKNGALIVKDKIMEAWDSLGKSTDNLKFKMLECFTDIRNGIADRINPIIDKVNNIITMLNRITPGAIKVPTISPMSYESVSRVSVSSGIGSLEDVPGSVEINPAGNPTGGVTKTVQVNK